MLPGYAAMTCATTPIVVRKSDASLTLAATGAGVWADCDTTGSSASRSYDVVIPGCKAGDWVDIVPRATVAGGGTSAVLLDVFTIVSGSPVNAMSGGDALGAWIVLASATTMIGARVSYQVQAGDLENVVGGVGSVRLRLRYSKASGTSGTLNAASASSTSWVMEGRGPFV
jgi:hypothetical protein